MFVHFTWADGLTLTWLLQAVSAGPVEQPQSDTLQSQSMVWKLPEAPRQRYFPKYEKILNKSQINYETSRWKARICMQHFSIGMAGVASPAICTQT